MKVQIKYRSGRLDVFDTDSYTPAQPFGDGCMLADYEVRFDRLEKGLWLQAHFYDADPRFKEGLDDGVVPVGRRSMGWRFLFAEQAELIVITVSVIEVITTTRCIPQWLSPVMEALDLTCLGSQQSPWNRRRPPGRTTHNRDPKGLQDPRRLQRPSIHCFRHCMQL